MHKSFQQNDCEQSPSSPNNYFTAQYTFYKPNQNMSMVSQENWQVSGNNDGNGYKGPLRFS